MDPNLNEAIRCVLFEWYPLTNPGLLARCAHEWYSEHGADTVFHQIIDRIREVCAIQPNDIDCYEQARKKFLRVESRITDKTAEYLGQAIILTGTKKP